MNMPNTSTSCTFHGMLLLYDEISAKLNEICDDMTKREKTLSDVIMGRYSSYKWYTFTAKSASDDYADVTNDPITTKPHFLVGVDGHHVLISMLDYTNWNSSGDSQAYEYCLDLQTTLNDLINERTVYIDTRECKTFEQWYLEVMSLFQSIGDEYFGYELTYPYVTFTFLKSLGVFK